MLWSHSFGILVEDAYLDSKFNFFKFLFLLMVAHIFTLLLHVKKKLNLDVFSNLPAEQWLTQQAGTRAKLKCISPRFKWDYKEGRAVRLIFIVYCCHVWSQWAFRKKSNMTPTHSELSNWWRIPPGSGSEKAPRWPAVPHRSTHARDNLRKCWRRYLMPMDRNNKWHTSPFTESSCLLVQAPSACVHYLWCHW